MVSPFGFVLAGLCFFLPFVTFGTADETMRASATWLGTDLTVGGEARLHLEELLWDEHLHRNTMQDVTAELAPLTRSSLKEPLFVPGQPAFIAAVVLVLLGVLAWLLVGVRARAWTAGVAGLAGAAVLAVGAGLALLRIARFTATSTVHPVLGYGFWLAAGLLVLLGAGNAVAAYRLRRPAEALGD